MKKTVRRSPICITAFNSPYSQRHKVPSLQTNVKPDPALSARVVKCKTKLLASVVKSPLSVNTFMKRMEKNSTKVFSFVSSVSMQI